MDDEIENFHSVRRLRCQKFVFFNNNEQQMPYLSRVLGTTGNSNDPGQRSLAAIEACRDFS